MNEINTIFKKYLFKFPITFLLKPLTSFQGLSVHSDLNF